MAVRMVERQGRGKRGEGRIPSAVFGCLSSIGILSKGDNHAFAGRKFVGGENNRASHDSWDSIEQREVFTANDDHRRHLQQARGGPSFAAPTRGGRCCRLRPGREYRADELALLKRHRRRESADRRDRSRGGERNCRTATGQGGQGGRSGRSGTHRMSRRFLHQHRARRASATPRVSLDDLFYGNVRSRFSLRLPPPSLAMCRPWAHLEASGKTAGKQRRSSRSRQAIRALTVTPRDCYSGSS